MATGKIKLIGLALLTGSLTLHAQEKESGSKPVTVPVRISVVPGLSTQGNNDVNTTSKFSLNIYGGVTGSVNGVEVGSLFNIDKKNVQYAQAAGLFNMVGGNFKGAQAGGLFNSVGANVEGIQAAGLSNFVKKNVRGIQVSGIHNFAGQKLEGIQAAGISNFAGNNVRGIQVAGISNISKKGTAGIQVSGIVNYARHLKGLQVGLINIADTSEGFSVGLLTFVKRGYHKVSLYSNEVLNMNIAYRSGNAKLYNIIMAGINAGTDNKAFSYGYGIGHAIELGNRLSINPEITAQYMYLGNWHYFNLLSKFHVVLNVELVKGISVFVAPSFTTWYTEQQDPVHGYKFKLPSNNYHSFNLWNNVDGWIGWSAGITFF